MTATELIPAPTPEDLPTASSLEASIGDAADRIIAAGKKGYAWDPVDELMKDAFDTDGPAPSTRCKQANNSGRAANVLTESNDKEVDLYLVFIRRPYTVAAFCRAAVKRVKRFPRIRTVVVLEQINNKWRATAAVERKDVDLSDRLKLVFPAISQRTIKVEGAVDTSIVASETVVETTDVDIFMSAAQETETTISHLDVLPGLFVEYARSRGFQVNEATSIDLLASALASQMVLFAGPSGTGKSSMARALADFLTLPDAVATIEARSGWGGPEDAVGYYSSLTNRFAQTPDTVELVALHEVSGAALFGSEPDAPAPVLIVEEANLSAIEGYLAPVTHGFSRPSSPYLRWNLHAQQLGATDTDDLIDLPPTLLLGPWPRVFATINVDANSAAPARKVTARAAVVLLEPDDSFDVAREAAWLTDSAPPEETNHEVHRAPSNRILGDPAAARRRVDRETMEGLLAEFARLLEVAGGTSTPIIPSKRDVERAANYLTYFRLLADGDLDDETVRSVAAENAVVHYVLSQLPAESFSAAVANLQSAQLTPATAGGIGGQLRSRINRLNRVIQSAVFADSVDFWASLS